MPTHAVLWSKHCIEGPSNVSSKLPRALKLFLPTVNFSFNWNFPQASKEGDPPARCIIAEPTGASSVPLGWNENLVIMGWLPNNIPGVKSSLPLINVQGHKDINKIFISYLQFGTYFQETRSAFPRVQEVAETQI